MHVRAELIEGQEEQVLARAKLYRDDRAEIRQQLTVGGGVVRAADGRGERREGLPCRSQHAVDADADPAELQIAAERRGRIQVDERRLVEQVAVVVVLARREHDVGLRHVGQRADIEQQEVLLADAGGEVLLDLRGGQRAVVDGDELDDALPRMLTGDLITDHEREGVVPVGERAALGRIDVAGEHAVDIEPLAVDRIVGQHHVLQGGLRGIPLAVVVISGGMPSVLVALLRVKPSYCIASWPSVMLRVVLLPE